MKELVVKSSAASKLASYSGDPVGSPLAFGDFLTFTGRLNAVSLERALRLADDEEQNLASTLIGLGLISDKDLALAYADFLGIEALDRGVLPDRPILPGEINPLFLSEYQVLVLDANEDYVAVAMADPLDNETIAALRFALQKPLQVSVASIGDIGECLEKMRAESQFAGTSDGTEGSTADYDSADIDRLRDSASEAPVIRIVNQIIGRAVEIRASDIHFEPTAEGVDIRYRVDGILRNVDPPPAKLRMAIISRLKIMSNLDIAERRMAQDGRVTLAIRGRDIDFRVSTMPTLHGESVVLRVLDRSGLVLELPALGFSGLALEAWTQAIRRRRGIVLVTGPTGSGKTTTLYASVLAIADRGRKVLTIEDPIEYQLPMINQTQVKPAVNLTFSNALRWSLRHDPDVMMIGEIRDLETAQIAVQAALTGHLILSTLHTNDAASAVTRLINLGIEPYLLTSTINAIAAQRLVRLLCKECSRWEELPAGVADSMGLKSRKVKLPVGCSCCGQTGFHGRTALVEVLSITKKVKQLIFKHAEADEIQDAGISEGMQTLRQQGLDLVETGMTSPDETFRLNAEI